jgi:hypothetical protein
MGQDAAGADLRCGAAGHAGGVARASPLADIVDAARPRRRRRGRWTGGHYADEFAESRRASPAIASRQEPHPVSSQA